MFKRAIFLLFAATAFFSCGSAPKAALSELPIADPYILVHEGKYYAYGTGENGFRVYTSEDLKHWTKGGIVLDMDKSWGSNWFWAPEVYHIESKGKFYLFYSAEEHICVATSDSPLGPFTQEVIRPIRDERGIDTSLFIDDDGTPYLFFVRFTDGNVIWVARMEDDLMSIREETLTECLSATQPWELRQAKVVEGPSVFKNGDTYYLLYSANDYKSQDYGVGYATASSPFGPWTKYEGNPIFHRSFPNAGGLVGIGHGAPFHDLKGRFRYVFHAHQNDSTIHPRTTYICTSLRLGKDGTISMPGKVIVPSLDR